MELPASLLELSCFLAFMTLRGLQPAVTCIYTAMNFWHNAPLLNKTTSGMLSVFSKMTWFITNNICFWFKFTVNISNSREIDAVHEEYKQKLRDQEAFHRKQIQRQQLYVEDLKQQILRGQIKAEQELENDQALINQQIQESGYLPLPLPQFPSITACFHPLNIFCPSDTFF